MAAEFTHYLHSVARQLRLEPGEEREITLELGIHLEDKAAELEAQGMDWETALSLAIKEVGDPRTVARNMYAVHSRGVWRDVLLATLPHFLLASLFALHLGSHYFLVALILIVFSFVTWINWRAGNPSKWSYSWLGYTLAAPALSWLLCLITLGYGGWTLVTTGELSFNVFLFVLLIGYVPFPFLISWVLFLNWQGCLWSEHGERMQESDTDRAFIFLTLAVTTAVSLPVSFGFLSVLLMILASVVFLLSPAVLESQIHHRGEFPNDYSGGEVVTHWFAHTT